MLVVAPRNGLARRSGMSRSPGNNQETVWCQPLRQ